MKILFLWSLLCIYSHAMDKDAELNTSLTTSKYLLLKFSQNERVNSTESPIHIINNDHAPSDDMSLKINALIAMTRKKQNGTTPLDQNDEVHTGQSEPILDDSKSSQQPNTKYFCEIV